MAVTTELQVAFFRALNLGHRGSPTRPVLEDAFTEAGATLVRTVQTNGTVVFSASDPAGVVGRVRQTLARAAAYEHPVLVRPASWVVRAVEGFPDYDDVPGVHRACVTLHDAPEPPDIEVPWTNASGLLVVLRTTADHTCSVVRASSGAAADPNSHLERLLGVPATTRTLGTFDRVCSVLARLSQE
jgi:uncharacterized protein (DUF1697 family)